MLKEIGIGRFEELFSDIKETQRKWTGGNLQDEPVDEIGLRRHMDRLLSKNSLFSSRCFIGGGPWFHYAPSVVAQIISRGEFLTSYTPYQPEVSQGVLQALFEYQSMICELYGMEVANASMYDLPTSVGEAALLCSRVTERKVFAMPAYTSRSRRSVVENLTKPQSISIRYTPHSPESGGVDLESLKMILDRDVAGVYLESPTYLGVLDGGLKEAIELVHDAGALAVLGADPLSLALFKPPGELGADIAVGDGQPLGIPPGMGGNSLGIMACRDDQRIVRQMPGRIVGLTKTISGGRRGFVLALATREQHIRRERATSNICTNMTLMAIAASVYLASMGRDGMHAVAERIMENTAYAMKRLKEVAGMTPLFNGVHFRDFVMIGRGIDGMEKRLLSKGIVGGKDISEDIGVGGTRLYAVTEVMDRRDIDAFADSLSQIEGGH